MKKYHVLLILTFCLIKLDYLNAQDFDEYYITFENNDYEYLEFDNSGIWQVGKPQKGDWNEAASSDNVLMTDTLNYLKTPVKTWFTFKYEAPWWSNCINGWYIGFAFKTDLPYQKAGLYVETSYNHGSTWYQIMQDTFLNNNSDSPVFLDTLNNNIIGLSGNNGDYWPESIDICGKSFNPDTIAAKVKSVWLRIVYENLDTIPHKGIIIDNMYLFFGNYCEFIGIEEMEESNSQIYPNPIIGISTLEINNHTNNELLIEIYSIDGLISKKEYICDNSYKINKSDYKSGYYLYRVIANNQTIQSGKFLVH